MSARAETLLFLRDYIDRLCESYRAGEPPRQPRSQRFILALALLVGYRTMFLSVAMTVVLVTGSGIVHSFGKVDHFILFELLPVAMAASGWAPHYPSMHEALRTCRLGDRRQHDLRQKSLGLSRGLTAPERGAGGARTRDQWIMSPRL